MNIRVILVAFVIGAFGVFALSHTDNSDKRFGLSMCLCGLVFTIVNELLNGQSARAKKSRKNQIEID